MVLRLAYMRGLILELMNQFCTAGADLEVLKLFSYSTQLSTKFILFNNVIVGSLIFSSMINTTSEGLKERNFFICRYFSFYEQLKFRA